MKKQVLLAISHMFPNLLIPIGVGTTIDTVDRPTLPMNLNGRHISNHTKKHTLKPEYCIYELEGVRKNDKNEVMYVMVNTMTDSKLSVNKEVFNELFLEDQI